MITYEYENIKSPDLDAIQNVIIKSSMADKSIQYCRWDEETKKLQTIFKNELSADDKIILDEIVNSNPISSVPFSVDKFISDLFNSFSGAINLFPYYAVIKDTAASGNFLGMKLILNGLVAAGIMTQDQFNLLNSILQIQNIDLNNL